MGQSQQELLVSIHHLHGFECFCGCTSMSINLFSKRRTVSTRETLKNRSASHKSRRSLFFFTSSENDVLFQNRCRWTVAKESWQKTFHFKRMCQRYFFFCSTKLAQRLWGPVQNFQFIPKSIIEICFKTLIVITGLKWQMVDIKCPGRFISCSPKKIKGVK